MKLWTQALLALLAGTSITASLAPYSMWWSAIIGLALLLYVLNDASKRRAFFLGWCFGLGLFGTGISWVYVSIHLYGNAPAFLAGILTLLFASGLALLSGMACYLLRLINPHSALIDLLLFPAIWVIGEWLRTWLLSGFPWLFAGYAHVQGPLQGWAPVIGVFGISFIIALSAGFIACFARLSFRSKVTTGLVVTVFWLSGMLVSPAQWTSPTGDHVRVGLVQANIDQNEKWLASKIPAHIVLQEQMSEPLWGHDLVLWPESAIPMIHHRAQRVLNRLQNKAISSGSTFITGIPYQDQNTAKVYNSIVTLGEQPGMYQKQKLVPFGEFMPLENLLRGIIDFFDLPMSSFSAGPENQAYFQLGQHSVAPLICYEAVYPALLLQHPAGVPDLLLTISNDTWFGTSIGPLQHLEMAQMRALELGRSMIRGTNNGVSALITPYGEISHRSEQFKQQVLSGRVIVQQGDTPFSKLGSWPVLGLSFLILVWAVLVRPKMA